MLAHVLVALRAQIEFKAGLVPEQVQVKSSVRVQRRILHLQYICVAVLGDQALGFRCQFVASPC